jgi:hypothetical protein
MNQDDYIKQLEKQIDDLQQKYGEDSIRVKNYDELMTLIVSRSKLTSNDSGLLNIEMSLTLNPKSIIEDNKPLAEFVTKALIEHEKQDMAMLGLAVFLESGAEGIELPDNG